MQSAHRLCVTAACAAPAHHLNLTQQPATHSGPRATSLDTPHACDLQVLPDATGQNQLQPHQGCCLPHIPSAGELPQLPIPDGTAALAAARSSKANAGAKSHHPLQSHNGCVPAMKCSSYASRASPATGKPARRPLSAAAVRSATQRQPHAAPGKPPQAPEHPLSNSKQQQQQQLLCSLCPSYSGMLMPARDLVEGDTRSCLPWKGPATAMPLRWEMAAAAEPGLAKVTKP